MTCFHLPFPVSYCLPAAPPWPSCCCCSLFKLAIPNFASRCLTVIIEGYAREGQDAHVLSSFGFRQNVFFFCFCSLGR